MIRASEVVAACERLGFALAGVCRARPSDWSDAFRSWLASGQHGTMFYLAEQVEVRLDITKLLPNARSIVMVGDVYAPRGRDEPRSGRAGEPRGRIARYARGRDYHQVIKRRLYTLRAELRARFAGHEHAVFVDLKPTMDREHALRAGLGWIGKHTLLINPKLGSWFVLGGLATTLEIEPSPGPLADACGTCTRCIDACPTGAISPYRVDASRCVSYLTIERRRPIAPELHEGMRDWVLGCDVCQEVCPHNSPRPGAEPPARPNPAYAARRESLPLFEVLGWRETDWGLVAGGTAMKRAFFDMIKRNAIIALGNAALAPTSPPTLRSEVCRRLRELVSDPSEPALAREAASATLRRIGG